MTAYAMDRNGSLVRFWNDGVPPEGGEVVVAGTAVVAETVTLQSRPASPRVLRVDPGDRVQPGPGVAVTIDAPIRAGRWRIFDLDRGGSVLLGPNAAADVRPEWFGAAGDGRTDDLAALQAMARSLPAGARVLLAGRYRIRYPGRRADPVYGIRITQPNVWVVGEGGGAGIFMDGFDHAVASQVHDPAGIDRFTAIGFWHTSGGGVTGVRFTGNGDGAPLYAAGTPGRFVSRAKGVGITNSSDVTIRAVTGEGIVGNVVNARGDRGAGCRRVRVLECHAGGCSENGFNFMGGTHDCVFNDNISIQNGFCGFESGTVGISCRGNLCRDNQLHGISHVGSGGTFENNTLTGNRRVGFVFQAEGGALRGQQNVLSGSLITGNGEAGISADPATYGNTIRNNQLRDNGRTVAQGILLVANPGGRGPADYVITGNQIEDTRRGLVGAGGVIANGATGLVVTGNTFRMAMQYNVIAVGGRDQRYSGNVTNQPSSVRNVANLSARGDILP